MVMNLEQEGSYTQGNENQLKRDRKKPFGQICLKVFISPQTGLKLTETSPGFEAKRRRVVGATGLT